MRKQAMINSVKDSLFLAILAGITYGIFLYINVNYPKDKVEIFVMVVLIVGSIIAVNILSALGASMLYGTPYHSNKKRYRIRAALFNEDKTSSGFHMIKIIFYYIIGAIFYPIALIVALFSLKDLFKKNEIYYHHVMEENRKLENENQNDIKVKANKKWKIKPNLLTDYYFNTYEDAKNYADGNNISRKKILELF